MYEAKFTFASNICCMISQSFPNMEMLVFFQSPKVIFKHITRQILFTRPVLDSYAFSNTFHTSIFFGFVALCPKSTAMFTAGWTVHLTTLFPEQAWTSSKTVLRAHTFACNWQQPFLNDWAEVRRMTVEIISWSISMKVWDWSGIELATLGSAVRHASVARHITDCATWPGFTPAWHLSKVTQCT